MLTNKENERIKNCSIALGVDKPERAVNIIESELMRIEYDERRPEKRGVIIQVKGSTQKLIVETLIELLKENHIQQTEDNKNINHFITIRIGEGSEKDEQPDNVINLEEFDFDKEKDKLISRCNATLIGNAKIRDLLLREDFDEENKPSQNSYDNMIYSLQEELREVNENIREYENSLLGIFRSDELQKFYEEEEALMEELEKYQRRSEREEANKLYKSSKRKGRISALFQKEEKLQTIKYIFTGKRERLLRGIDMKGKEVAFFEEEKAPQENVGENTIDISKYEIR